MIDNSYEHIYARNRAIRRWPSEDVVRFCSHFQSQARLVADLGSGTGRNLVPQLLSLASGGAVYATDIAESGVKSIVEWAAALGAVPVPFEKTEELNNTALADVKILEGDIIFKIGFNKGLLDYSYGALFQNQNDHSAADTVFLVCRVSDMRNNLFNKDSLDAVINRGSIFFLPENEIRETLQIMHNSLKKKGRALISFKSLADSNFQGNGMNNFTSTCHTRGMEGLRVVFFNEERVSKIMAGWKIITMEHVVEEDFINGFTIANYIVTAEKP